MFIPQILPPLSPPQAQDGLGFHGRWWTQVTNNLSREVLEVAHLLLGLVEFLEKVHETENADDSGGSQNSFTVYGNHYYSGGFTF